MKLPGFYTPPWISTQPIFPLTERPIRITQSPVDPLLSELPFSGLWLPVSEIDFGAPRTFGPPASFLGNDLKPLAAGRVCPASIPPNLRLPKTSGFRNSALRIDSAAQRSSGALPQTVPVVPQTVYAVTICPPSETPASGLPVGLKRFRSLTVCPPSGLRNSALRPPASPLATFPSSFGRRRYRRSRQPPCGHRPVRHRRSALLQCPVKRAVGHPVGKCRGLP